MVRRKIQREPHAGQHAVPGTNGEMSHLRALSPTQSLTLRQVIIVISQTANMMIVIRLAVSFMTRSTIRSACLIVYANLSLLRRGL